MGLANRRAINEISGTQPFVETRSAFDRHSSTDVEQSSPFRVQLLSSAADSADAARLDFLGSVCLGTGCRRQRTWRFEAERDAPRYHAAAEARADHRASRGVGPRGRAPGATRCPHRDATRQPADLVGDFSAAGRCRAASCRFSWCARDGGRVRSGATGGRWPASCSSDRRDRCASESDDNSSSCPRDASRGDCGDGPGKHRQSHPGFDVHSRCEADVGSGSRPDVSDGIDCQRGYRSGSGTGSFVRFCGCRRTRARLCGYQAPSRRASGRGGHDHCRAAHARHEHTRRCAYHRLGEELRAVRATLRRSDPQRGRPTRSTGRRR